MHLALREIRRFRVPLLIWLMLSVVAAVAGPFGTMEAMMPVDRLLYWGGVVGGSILLNFATVHLSRDMGRWSSFAVWLGFVLLVSVLSHGLNTLIFEAWGGFADWTYLAAIVGLVTVAIHLLIWAVVPRAIPEDDQLPEGEIFQRRLPMEYRGSLVRIEAQDHYLNVVTTQGQTLILMRLGDAMAELGAQGLQVHRSHWVALNSVTKHRRSSGRNILVMSDAAEVPVSRSFRSAAQAAGLF